MKTIEPQPLFNDVVSSEATYDGAFIMRDELLDAYPNLVGQLVAEKLANMLHDKLSEGYPASELFPLIDLSNFSDFMDEVLDNFNTFYPTMKKFYLLYSNHDFYGYVSDLLTEGYPEYISNALFEGLRLTAGKETVDE